MGIEWNEVQKALTPIKDYEDLCHRFQVSFGYSFVYVKFNYTIPQLKDYTQKLLLGDSRNRYVEYHNRLNGIMKHLDQAGVQFVIDLKDQTATRELLEKFVEKTGISAIESISIMKYLIYWFIPGEKYMSGLVRDDPAILEAIKKLSVLGIRTNLQVLEMGISHDGRRSLSASSGLAPEIISELVNRADFSRLPWASKATISNFIGAGYSSLNALVRANPDKLYEDFFRYGHSIGKNLKLGNEIENSYRIAKLVPILVEND
jgi:hypothetical protein